MDERELYELSEMQHNLVARRQARDLGFDRRALTRRVVRGEWTPVTNRVLRRSGAAPDEEEAVMAAVLHAGPDAVASLLAAAWVWGVPGFGPGAVDVARSRRAAGGGDGHRPRLLLPHHVTIVRGIPVTTLPVTFAHLAGSPEVSPGRIERAVATVVGRAPSLLPALDAVVVEFAKRGRPGIPMLREILANQDRSGIVKTGLERRFEHVLGEAGEPPMDAQVDLGGHAWIGRVDYVDRLVLLIAEIDSVTHHSSAADKLRDAARDRALIAAGCRKVIRIPEEWVWYEPWRAVAAVRDARQELRQAAA